MRKKINMPAIAATTRPDYDPMQNLAIRPIVSIVLAAMAIILPVACNRSAAPAEEKAPPATVKWEAPLQGALEEWIELVGTTSPLPDRIARVSASLEGRVASILGDSGGKPVIEGQRVEKGTVLVQLDTTIIQMNLEKAEAAQAVLREEEDRARNGVEQAQTDFDRYRKLKDEDEKQPPKTKSPLVPAADWQRVVFALKDAQSKLRAASAQLAAGAKDVESYRAQLKLHTLSSPIAGRVGRIQVVRGQALTVGTAVADVIDLDEQIDVVCFVPPSLIGRLKVGLQARLGGFDPSANGATPVEIEGQIEFIADQAEPETGNFAMKVRFPNKEAKLPANRVQRVRILTKPGRECLSLPEGAVQEDGEKPTAVIVTEVKTGKNSEGKDETTGVARRVQVILGVRDRILHQIEIIRLDDPEKDQAKKWHGEVKDALFVVEGGQGLQSGDAVKLEVEEE
jgi:RND family efflux transporter MFP subunit